MLYSASPDVLFQQVDADGVLLSLRDEVYYGVNETAAAVWRLLEQAPRALPEIVGALAERYPDAPVDELAADVAELLDGLAANGLIVRADAAAPIAPDAPSALPAARTLATR